MNTKNTNTQTAHESPQSRIPFTDKDGLRKVAVYHRETTGDEISVSLSFIGKPTMAARWRFLSQMPSATLTA